MAGTSTHALRLTGLRLPDEDVVLRTARRWPARLVAALNLTHVRVTS